MKRRYSIWGREWGADFDVELAQVDSNPGPVMEAFKKKRLTTRHSIFERGARITKVQKFSGLRIVDNGTA